MRYYKIRVIQLTAPNAYHVTCTNDNVTHSSWGSYEQALLVMRDLNAAERRVHRANKAA
jgi:hypothetical protein